MHKRPTRPLAFVALLLALLALGPWFGDAIHAASQRANNKIMVPVVAAQPPAPTHELRITHLSLTQSVQNSANTVSLVAGKPALLRVYAQETTGADSPALASVTVHASRDGASLGSLTVGPQAVSRQPRHEDLASTFNLDLPAVWLSGDVTLTAHVDDLNAVAEYDEDNNRRGAVFTFHDVAPLSLTIVPIHYRHLPTGTLFTAPPHDPLSDWLLSAFPLSEIDVTLRAPYVFSGDLRRPADWQRLLGELTAVWTAEVGAGSPHVYFGLIPIGAQGGESWFEGGISGLGWIGQRVSLGLDLGDPTGVTAGHELGHNFGRRHAPCGNPSGVDPHYPYPNASIGAIGVDTAEDELLLPNANFDMMSYCGPEWVSDYTYQGLFADQRARGGLNGAAADGLLLRADLSGGTAAALPVYAVDATIIPAIAERTGAGDYTVELLGRDGAVIATHPATLFEAEEVGARAEMLLAQVPAPGAEVAAIRFRRGDAVVAERMLTTVTASRDRLHVSTERSAGGLSLAWSAADVPALVQYSADGESWTTLGVDVVGGRLALTDGQLQVGAGRFRIVPADGGVPVVVEIGD